jgi:hypothetical protein
MLFRVDHASPVSLADQIAAIEAVDVLEPTEWGGWGLPGHARTTLRDSAHPVSTSSEGAR